MRNLLIFALLASITASAQQHFAGIGTSSRGGIMSGLLNPAELANNPSKYDVFIFAPSIVASNNKLGIGDLIGGDNLEEKLFSGSETVNLRIDGEIVGPGFAYKHDKWTFALMTKAYARLDLVDVDPNIGDAIVNGGLNSLVSTTTLNNDYNQRLTGTSWGEVGISVARNLYDDQQHSFGAGVTLKILFPGSYANFGARDFNGTIVYAAGDVELTDASASVNIAYSGNLGESFSQFGDYTGSLFGKPNGFAADLGVNYRWKDEEEGRYKLNAGLAIRNLGGMTFSDTNNASTNYELNIPATESLNLNQFQDIESLQEVEEILLASGYLNRTENNATDFKVQLPATFVGYADVKIIQGFYATIFTQQKIKENNENDQIAVENVTSLTPRYLLNRNIEFYVPLSVNEISGFSAGFGFRAYGFFIGSSSAFTALSSNAKQADVYLGYGFRI
ncbi:DUF5723 domain-containing protein [Flavobacterium longum]|uniref:DUF5723 family protein n=1 Tax=Flavobacterium longum TaxID=1299340 RepID=UPI0039E9E466